MIEELHVRDLAVVERADISFAPGLVAVTGETGAGKSVLLGAIGLLVGARSDRESIRAGAARADVSARFALPSAALAAVAPILEESGIDPCEDGALLVSRSVSATGSGRCHVNNCPASVQTLRRIGEHLVDFHGPHDNQSLLSSAFQLEALDSFADSAALRAAYGEKWRALRELEERRDSLQSAASGGSVEREIDMLRYQTREISEAALDPEADGDALREEYSAAVNAARILELGSAACAALSESDGNAVDAAAAAVRALEEMRDLSSRDAAGWLERLSALSEGLSDLSREIASSLSSFDASPERLAELEARMSLVENLRHKYGRTIPDVLDFLAKAGERLSELEGRGETLARLEGEIAEARKGVMAAGRALSASRRKAAAALGAAVVKQLSDLGLARAGFEANVADAAAPGPSGLDDVTFLFAPNPGEPPRPLRAIASSGEISRVMLALKTVLAAHDRIPVLVFDEIDANVGGEIARVVGRKLAALGRSRQVLCITHLPQVASCAATQFLVRKRVKGGRTETMIDRLDGEARVDELSRMLGGEKLTSVVREHARQLLASGAGAALAALTALLPALFAPEVRAGSPPEPCLRRAEAAVASLDPSQAATVAAGRAVALVYETPLQFSYGARPYRLGPYAAEEMPEISGDGLEITLRLRPDVWFDLPGGARRRATADDLVYSLKRLADAKLASPGYWIVAGRVEGASEFHAASLDQSVPTDYSADVPGLRALDERTVRIRLVAPDPEFLWCLALPYASLVPREAVEALGDAFGGSEFGSGPFRLASWRRGHKMLFVRREGRDTARDFAAEDAPNALDGAGAEGLAAEPYASVEYLQIADPSTKWLSFLSGALDYASEISRDDWDAVIGPDGALSPELAARGVKMVSQPALDTSYIAFNMDDPVVGGTNAALRRALSCAFDRAQWLALNRGRYAAASGPVPPGIDGRVETPEPFGYDPERARSLLAQAGYPGGVDAATGRRLELSLEIGRTDQEAREGAELVAAFFADVGVSLVPHYSTFPLFIRKLAGREAQMFLVSWLADYPDALNFMQLFVSSNASPGPNRCNYSDPEFDALYAAARRETDPASRRVLLGRMQERIRSQCPWICVAHRREIVLLGPTLGGFRLHDFPYGAEKHWYRVPPRRGGA